MVNCCIYGCKSRSEQNQPNLTFHRFPNEPILKNKWTECTGRINWHPSRHSRICSRHFEASCIRQKINSTHLNPRSIPTLFIQMNTKVYKSCGVPQCKNTSIKTPDKLFVYVPHNKTIRNKWLKLARRDSKKILLSTQLYFCEDHFDLPNDMANYMEYHLMGSVSQILMKPGCMPTKFQCQPDRRKRTSDATERPYILRKQRKTLIEECQKDLEEISTKQVQPKERKGVLKKITTSDETLENDSSSSETLSIPEDETEMMLTKDEIKMEITIDEDDNLIPYMQILKTELDPLEKNEEQFSEILHDHSYTADLSTQPETVPYSHRDGSEAKFQSNQTKTIEDSSPPPLHNKHFKNMAQKLKKEKALNDKNTKIIKSLRVKVKRLNSQLWRGNLTVDKLKAEINLLKFENNRLTAKLKN